jgi:hypothetical protein
MTVLIAALNTLDVQDAAFLAELTELLRDCCNCGTVYRFVVTRDQALRYHQRPRTELIQDIFPDIPIPARAVLTQGNMCGLCLPQLNEAVKDEIRTFILQSPAIVIDES